MKLSQSERDELLLAVSNLVEDFIAEAEFRHKFKAWRQINQNVYNLDHLDEEVQVLMYFYFVYLKGGGDN